MAATDADIVQAVNDGDTDAYRVLVDRHKRRLYAVLLRLVGDPDLAEDLAQEAFVKAFRSLAGFRQDASFGTWLVQIGIHAARDRLRSARRRRGTVSIEALQEARGRDLELADRSPRANPGVEIEADEERRLMRAALAELPADYREVLVLKHFEGWAYGQIAEATGDSVGTLKVRAYRARQLLRERLAEMGWVAADSGRSRPAEGGSVSRS